VEMCSHVAASACCAAAVSTSAPCSARACRPSPSRAALSSTSASRSRACNSSLGGRGRFCQLGGFRFCQLGAAHTRSGGSAAEQPPSRGAPWAASPTAVRQPAPLRPVSPASWRGPVPQPPRAPSRSLGGAPAVVVATTGRRGAVVSWAAQAMLIPCCHGARSMHACCIISGGAAPIPR
jgi:hypothetical protein